MTRSLKISMVQMCNNLHKVQKPIGPLLDDGAPYSGLGFEEFKMIQKYVRPKWRVEVGIRSDETKAIKGIWVLCPISPIRWRRIRWWRWSARIPVVTVATRCVWVRPVMVAVRGGRYYLPRCFAKQRGGADTRGKRFSMATAWSCYGSRGVLLPKYRDTVKFRA